MQGGSKLRQNFFGDIATCNALAHMCQLLTRAHEPALQSNEIRGRQAAGGGGGAASEAGAGGGARPAPEAPRTPRAWIQTELRLLDLLTCWNNRKCRACIARFLGWQRMMAAKKNCGGVKRGGGGEGGYGNSEAAAAAARSRSRRR